MSPSCRNRSTTGGSGNRSATRWLVAGRPSEGWKRRIAGGVAPRAAPGQRARMIFYPAVRGRCEDVEDLLDEAEVEHASVKRLVEEIESESDDHFAARVTVL